MYRTENRISKFYDTPPVRYGELFDRQTEDGLDTRDQRPASVFDAYFGGVVTGIIYGLFFGWLVFGNK